MKPGIRRLMEDLRGARVLVVHPRDAEGDALIDQLKRIGCNVRGLWPPPAEIPRDVDTVSPVAHGRDAAEVGKFTVHGERIPLRAAKRISSLREPTPSLV